MALELKEQPKSIQRSESYGVNTHHLINIEPVQQLSRAVTNPDPSKNGIVTYEVRPCRVDDTNSIDNIIRVAWPDEPEWRNPQYWTKQFLQPNSKRFGFVIEEINNSYDTNKKHNHQNEINNVIGVAMYKWTKPKQYKTLSYGYDWYIEDFNTTQFQWRHGYQHTNTKGGDKYESYYNNLNLQKNWLKLSTHFVHITDVAIHPNYRGKGLGTQLMQTMIYSFPSKTRFALEVKSDNIGGIKCYAKCAFVKKRTMAHYYGRNKPGTKMSLVSDYDDSEVEKFMNSTELKRSKKHFDDVKKQLENFHLSDDYQEMKGNDDMDVDEDGVDIDMVLSPMDKRQTVQLSKALKALCGDDWVFYYQRFVNEEIFDNDLPLVSEENLKKLIPKIGPRCRVRAWIKQMN